LEGKDTSNRGILVPSDVEGDTRYPSPGHQAGLGSVQTLRSLSLAPSWYNPPSPPPSRLSLYHPRAELGQGVITTVKGSDPRDGSLMDAADTQGSWDHALDCVT
jgi:hypothetical protein